MDISRFLVNYYYRCNFSQIIQQYFLLQFLPSLKVSFRTITRNGGSAKERGKRRKLILIVHPRYISSKCSMNSRESLTFLTDPTKKNPPISLPRFNQFEARTFSRRIPVFQTSQLKRIRANLIFAFG